MAHHHGNISLKEAVLPGPMTWRRTLYSGPSPTNLILSANQRFVGSWKNTVEQYDKHNFRKLDKFVEIRLWKTLVLY